MSKFKDLSNVIIISYFILIKRKIDIVFTAATVSCAYMGEVLKYYPSKKLLQELLFA